MIPQNMNQILTLRLKKKKSYKKYQIVTKSTNQILHLAPILFARHKALKFKKDHFKSSNLRKDK